MTGNDGHFRKLNNTTKVLLSIKVYWMVSEIFLHIDWGVTAKESKYKLNIVGKE